MTFARAKPAGWTDDVETITATQLNHIDVNQSRAIDGTAGGTYTPSATIEVGGQGVRLTGSGNLGKLQLSSRSITRVRGGSVATPDTTGNWTPAGLQWTNGVVGTTLYAPLPDIPHGATLTSVSVWIDPPTHINLPENMPSITLQEIVLATGAAGAIGGATDTSANVAAYNARHAITKGGLAWPVDRSLASYHVVLVAESGANSAVGTTYVGVEATWTQTYADDGAG